MSDVEKAMEEIKGVPIVEGWVDVVQHQTQNPYWEIRIGNDQYDWTPKTSIACGVTEKEALEKAVNHVQVCLRI